MLVMQFEIANWDFLPYYFVCNVIIIKTLICKALVLLLTALFYY